MTAEGVITVADEGDPFLVVRRDGEMIGELCVASTERWVDTACAIELVWHASAIIINEEGEREMIPAPEPFPLYTLATLWIEETAA